LAFAFKMDDPHLLAPLAPFEGRTPDAPSWFNRALAQHPERSFVEVEGARVETLAWGERGRPGLLLLHGNGAHADWYSFIAPFLARTHRVVTLSWSGMGQSDWRQSYSSDQFVREAVAVMHATGLFEAGPPIVVGHSFGGRIAIGVAATHGENLAGAVIVDPPVFAPQHLKEKPPRQAPRSHRIYPSLAAGLARFRLAPAQPCDNLFILDYIARRSLLEVALHEVAPHAEAAPGCATGWTWRFDPFLWASLRHTNPMPQIRAAACPLALIRGGRSRLMKKEDAAHMMSALPQNAPYIEVPEADHHVMIDQPLAFVAAIETLLAAWPAAAPR
jgi:pimeloyl-ACP methyl ester carboxylesterase